MALTEEQEAKLAGIDEKLASSKNGGTLSAAQKALLVEFGKAAPAPPPPPAAPPQPDLKMKRMGPTAPPPMATIPPLEKGGGGTAELDPGPETKPPKPRW